MSDAESGRRIRARPGGPWLRFLACGAAILLGSIARLFWAAACGIDGPLARGPMACADPAWFDRAALLGAFLFAVLTTRGDWIRRYVMPALFAAAGWPWLLLFVAVRDTPTRSCVALLRLLEWLPRRCRDAAARPPAPEAAWSSGQRARATRLLLIGSLLVHAPRFCTVRRVAPAGDAAWYLDAADNILATGCFFGSYPLATDGRPSRTYATRMPGYPLFLAGCKRIAPRYHPQFAAGIQAVASACAVWLVYDVAELLSGPMAGLISGFLYILYTPLAAGAPRLLTESLAPALYLAAALVMLRAFRQGSARRFACAGALLGFTVLVRPQGILIPMAAGTCAAILLRRSGATPGHAARALLIPAAFAVVLCPWWVRNALRFGTFVPTTTLGGVTTWAGNDLRTRGAYRHYHYERATGVLRACGDNEVAADHAMWAIAGRQLKANARRPLAMASLLLRKAESLTRAPDAGEVHVPLHLHAVVLCLALLGMVTLRASPLSLLCAVAFASLVFVHLATYAIEPRYFRPLMPLVIAWAGVGLAGILRGTPTGTDAACGPGGAGEVPSEPAVPVSPGSVAGG